MRRILATLSLALPILAGPIAAHAAEPKPYPLDTCLVSGEKLGADPDMKPYVFVHAGQEIKLCCKSCLKDFNADPEKYLAKLKESAVPAAP
ncbi:MAG: hypothetical protein MUE94_03030 [Verrucomicrobia bacterium]|jgi:hypothetical protein|nr:hypothetical protein [Verrucomicrobiota bacterium]